MVEEIRVLHTDDDPEFSALTAEYLELVDDRFVVLSSTQVSESLEILADSSVDCIVSDYEIPEYDGIDFLHTVRELDSTLPFILFTGRGSEEIASEAISQGVTDYLKKGGPETYELLANRIQNYVEQHRIHRENQRQLAAIETTQEGISILTESGEFIYVNHAYADLYGYTPEEMEGMHWEEIYPAEETERMYETILPTVKQTGFWYGETIGLRTDGTTFVEDHTLATTDAGGIVCTVRDLTKRNERKHQINSILDSIEAAVWIRDAESRYQLINESYREELEIGSTDVTGLTPVDILGEELGNRFIDTDQRVLETGEPIELETTVTRQGTEMIKLNRLTPVFDRDGDISAICGVSTDITEQRTQERAAQRRAERLALSIEAGDIAVWEWDIANDRMEFDKRFEDLLGYESGELSTNPSTWIDLRHPDDNERVLEKVNALLTGEKERFEVEQRVRTQSGKWIWIHDIGRIVEWNEAGEPKRAVGCVHDITEQKSRERRLATQKHTLKSLLDRFEHVLQGTDTVVWEYTITDNSFEFFGPFQDLLAADSASLGSAEDFIAVLAHPDEEGIFTELFHTVLDGERREFEIECETPPENELVEWIRTYAFITGAENDPRRIVGLSTDISGRKRREIRLEQFAGVVSHDLRNPLNVIAGRLELAAEECDSEHIADANNAADRMHRLIEDLLTWTREGQSVDSVSSQPITSVSQLCWASVEPTTTTLQIDGDFCVMADRQRLHRLLENVFRNAVEHGGDTVTIGKCSDGFFVEDTGTGIPDSLLESVFEAGFSTSSDGTGFGLGIIDQIVDAHGWDVQLLESADGGVRLEFTGVEIVDMNTN